MTTNREIESLKKQDRKTGYLFAAAATLCLLAAYGTLFAAH
jgi:hypothetical protein